MDAESEKAICQTLKGLTGQVTILAISHQKAILQASDIAYRLDAGGVTLLSDELAFDDAVESNKGPLPESPNTAVAAG